MSNQPAYKETDKKSLRPHIRCLSAVPADLEKILSDIAKQQK